jgi:hypothetical protein
LKPSSRYYSKSFYPWLGIEKIHLQSNYEKKRSRLIKKYTKLKGELDRVVFHDHTHLSYDDHVTRIKVKGRNLDTALFSLPSLSDSQFVTLKLPELPSCTTDLLAIIDAHPQLKTPPGYFDYVNMEREPALNKPVCVGLPEGYGRDYIFNQEELLVENVLHLPIKISTEKARELSKEGRILANTANEAISCAEVYLPKELSYLKPFIEHVCQIEKVCNPDFIEQFYIFLSVSHSMIAPGSTQRRGGWHIDGHQGYERLQKNGKKLPCDRQYLIANVLPTQTISCQFNFDKVRDYCRLNLCDLDSVNMQDVIEQQASSVESKENVTTLAVNRLSFLNPYMVHRAVFNPFDQPIKRTFVRILFSVFPRDRLGDSVNPVLGPLYPLKIKTIRDIHELPI